MLNLDNETVLIALVAVTGAAVLLQAIILLGIFLTVRKAARTLTQQVNELHHTVMPILENVRDGLNRLTPKFEAVATDFVEITHGLRQQSVELHATVQEILERVSRQSAHLDAMLSGVLHSVERAGGFVASLARGPVRQVNGLMASAKAIVGALCAEGKPKQPTRTVHSSSTAGRDGFV